MGMLHFPNGWLFIHPWSLGWLVLFVLFCYCKYNFMTLVKYHYFSLRLFFWLGVVIAVVDSGSHSLALTSHSVCIPSRPLNSQRSACFWFWLWVFGSKACVNSMCQHTWRSSDFLHWLVCFPETKSSGRHGSSSSPREARPWGLWFYASLGCIMRPCLQKCK